MKLGVDFGSTYSTIARYNSVLDTVESLVLSEGASPSIPSIVSIATRNNRVACGVAAKEHINNMAGRRVFEAFKMLLPSNNEALLRSHGYDGQYTPKYITELFLSSTINNALERYHEEKVDSLVICIPEIWDRKKETINARNNLLSILKKIGSERGYIDKDNIRVINEPEAASAFIAYEFEKENKRKGIETGFNGHLLLVDYGGGTLDLTLVEVVSDGKGSMEIVVRGDGGEGENHFDESGKNEIGCAGIAYMQNVIVKSLEKCGIEDTIDYSTSKFLAAMKSLENELKDADRIREIRNAFDIYSSYNECKDVFDVPDDEDEFTVISYGDEEIPIYFKQLFGSYREVVEPVLAKEMKSINEDTERIIGKSPCDADAGMNNDFKIAIVGGFGGFYFVKRQLADIFNIDGNPDVDPRMAKIPDDKREQAISLGAALIAANKIRLRMTAKYSIGFYTTGLDENGAEKVDAFYYGIHFRQELEPDTTYFIKDQDGNDAVWGALSAASISKLAVEFSGVENSGALLNLRPEMINRLNDIPRGGFWKWGISLNRNEEITMVFDEKPIIEGLPKRGPIRIKLADFENTFNPTLIREVVL